MNDDLLTQYNRELAFIRHLAAQFAEENPRIADRLRLGQDSSEDPHVERLIQAFAFISGRLRQKLDDELPEISESLLGTLYPHYQNPIPSMAIVQMGLASDQEAPEGYRVKAGTPVETAERIDGEPCRFRTCYPVTLWPIEIEAAKLARPPGGLGLPGGEQAEAAERRAAAVLKLTLRCKGDKAKFGSLPLETLRFFLKGQSQHVYLLYELIFNHTVSLALAAGPRDREAVFINPQECLQQVGFRADEGMLPYGPRSFVGYRLLTEMFTFPEKYLFVDLGGGRSEEDRPTPLTPRLPKHVGSRLEVYLYLNRAVPDLEQHVSEDTFRLGCTPVINLYTRRADPIPLTHTQYQYRVAPDRRQPLAHEIYSIDSVTATKEGEPDQEYRPFYSVKHAARDGRTFWHASRQPAAPGSADRGTEVELALVDLGMKPSVAGGWTLDVETTCLNRDLPADLPFGGEMEITQGAALVGWVRCLTPFTRTLRPAQKRGAMWRLISHLTLNHLSLVDGNEQAEALREILKLYDFAGSPQTQKMISGVESIRGQRVVGRTGRGEVCRGIEVTITFDETAFTGNELFLFASVLERFLALYCTVNSFSKLVARRAGKGELRRWPPRVGEKILI